MKTNPWAISQVFSFNSYTGMGGTCELGKTSISPTEPRPVKRPKRKNTPDRVLSSFGFNCTYLK